MAFTVGKIVLSPALVTTTLSASATRRPERFGGPYEDNRAPAAALFGSQSALSPDAVANRVVYAIRHGEFFIFSPTPSPALG